MENLLETLFRVKVSSKGQVVIPKHIREALGLGEGDELILMPTNEGLIIRRPSKAGRLRGLLKGHDVDIAECEAILNEARRGLIKIIE